jgi:Fur family transcriptional regulator, ferric uptake regulator
VSSPSAWRERVLAELRDAGYRTGGARGGVVEYLDRQACCVSAQEIFDGLRRERRTVGIASIYRVLEMLADRRLVQRVDLGGGVAHFERATPGGEHHHHVQCAACGKVEPFTDGRLEDALERAAWALGYELGAHDVLLRGACEDCRPDAARAGAELPDA